MYHKISAGVEQQLRFKRLQQVSERKVQQQHETKIDVMTMERDSVTNSVYQKGGDNLTSFI